MAFDAMLRLMKGDLVEKLAEEVENHGSFLQKVAFRLSDRHGELGDAVQAAMFVAEKDPNRGKMLLDLLEQYASQALQDAMNKMVTESEDPSSSETDRIERMADLLRARANLGRDQMELMRVQKEVSSELGLSGMNPAMAATGQMPLPIAGGAPPMPMPPPTGVPPMMAPPGPMGAPGAPPMGAPMGAPPMGAPGAMPQQGPALPGSPMEAAAL